MTIDAHSAPTDNSPEYVALVVLNYNGVEDTLGCLKSVSALQPGPGVIHVVDNASSDDSVARIRRDFPSTVVSVNDANLGFGAGLNPVIQKLLDDGYEWIWLLNNDTRVAPDTLQHLLEQARQHPETAAIGARIVDMDPPHAIQTWGGGRIGWWRGNSRHFTRPVADGDIDYLTGASMLLRAAALRQTGLFDPGYFLYWEDVDLCLRLRTAGWGLGVAPDAVVRHRLSASTGDASPRKDELINASAIRFFRKHGPLGGWPAIVIGMFGRIARRTLSGNLQAARAVYRGARKGLQKTNW